MELFCLCNQVIISWIHRFSFVGLVLFHLEVIVISATTPCRFSQEWRGRYFQSGLGEIIIRENIITTKGNCIEQSRDYYLFDNREQNCYHCLLLIHQHRNLIQYKESFCTSPASLKVVCAQIRVETPLYTLVREPALPIRCPFQEAYHFKYNDLQHGFCEDQSSYAQPCASPSKYRIKFRHCDSSVAYHGKELDLECLASWKDGSETYLYSRLTGMDSSSKDDRYRCFKYHQYDNDVSLAMSADATCRGLRSAKDGPFLLEFTADTSGWPPSSCRFPDWLKAVTWRDLSGGHRFSVDDHGETMFVSLRKSGDSSTDPISEQFRCRLITSKVQQQQQQQQQQQESNEEYVIQTFATHNCVSKYQCMKLKRISKHIVEMRLGSPGDQEGAAYCKTDAYHNVQLLTKEEPMSESCPRPGMHHTAPADGCIYRLNVGCHSDTQIEINHSCSPGRTGLALECLTTWTDGSVAYVIVKQKQSDLFNCYSFREEGGSVVFGVDLSCNTNVTIIGDHTHLYSNLRHESCRRDARTTTISRKLAHHKSTTTTKATIDYNRQSTKEDYYGKDTSIRLSHSSSYNDEDDDDYDDDEYDIEDEISGTGDDTFPRNNVYGNAEIEQGKGSSSQEGRGTSPHGRSKMRPSGKVPEEELVEEEEDALIHKNHMQSERHHPATESDPAMNRKFESKGRKHVATVKPYFTHAQNSSRCLKSLNSILITTLILLTIFYFV